MSCANAGLPYVTHFCSIMYMYYIIIEGEFPDCVFTFEVSSPSYSICNVNAICVLDHPSQGSPEGLLMRFTAPVTYLAVNSNHTLLAAGSSEFNIKVTELADTVKTFNLVGHEAPVLCVKFDPRGEFLVSV